MKPSKEQVRKDSNVVSVIFGAGVSMTTTIFTAIASGTDIANTSVPALVILAPAMAIAAPAVSFICGPDCKLKRTPLLLEQLVVWHLHLALWHMTI